MGGLHYGVTVPTDRTKKRGGDTSAMRTLVLVLTTAEGRVVQITLPTEGNLIVGRGSHADLALEEESISRKHARIVGGRPPRLEDIGSTNGTRVQGRELAVGTRAPLELGTIVEFGDVIGVVRAREFNDSSVIPRGDRAHAEPSAEEVVLSVAVRALYDLLPVVAPSRLPILLLGDTGVGKEVFARAVHRASGRGDGPFVRLNCAALPEHLQEAELFGYEKGAFTGATNAKAGLVEAAHKGTLFLDEIGEMPLPMQAKLLRVIEQSEVLRLGSVKTKPVDVRYVTATHRDLSAMVEERTFREDLYYRINGVKFRIPPLRSRTEEIIPLAQRFADLAAGAPVTISPEAQGLLLEYRWPGNIRELKNAVERAVLLSRGGRIEARHFELESASPTRTSKTSAATEDLQPREVGDAASSDRARIDAALAQAGGNQTRAAKMLGISRSTLLRRLDEYGNSRPRK